MLKNSIHLVKLPRHTRISAYILHNAEGNSYQEPKIDKEERL
jgi:hypothetical protein